MKCYLPLLFLLSWTFCYSQTMCGEKYALIQKNGKNLCFVQSNFTPYKIVWKKNSTIVKINNSKYDSTIVIDSIKNTNSYGRLAINKNMDLFCAIYDNSAPVNQIIDSQEVFIYKYDYSNNKFINYFQFPKDTLYYNDLHSWINGTIALDSNSNLFLPDWKNKYFLKITPTKNIIIIDSNINKNQLQKKHTIENDSTLIIFYGAYTGDTAFRLNHNTFTKTPINNINNVRTNLYSDRTFIYKNNIYIFNRFNNVFQSYDFITNGITNQYYPSQKIPIYYNGQRDLYTIKATSNNIDSILRIEKLDGSLDSIIYSKNKKYFTPSHYGSTLDCSGNIYLSLYKTNIFNRFQDIVKIPSIIDSSLIYSNYNDTLKAIVHFHDGDSVETYIIPRLITNKIDTIHSCTSIIYKGKSYSNTGVYLDTLFNNLGIDTLFTLNLTIYKPKYDTSKQIACDSFIYKNTTYKNTGVYNFQYKSSTNCDSFHTLALTILKSTKDTQKAFSCTPYLWLDSTYNMTGFYSLKLKTSLGCDSIKYLDLKIGLDKSVILSNGTYFIAVQDSVSYQWYRCNPFRKITNETNKTFHTLTKGSYAVVINNNKGCIDTSKCIDLYSSSLDPYSNFSIRIYPNPFNSHLIVELDKLNQTTFIRLYDLTGKQILNNTYLNKDKIEINVESITKGVYYLQIETEKENHFFNIFKE